MVLDTFWIRINEFRPVVSASEMKKHVTLIGAQVKLRRSASAPVLRPKRSELGGTPERRTGSQAARDAKPQKLSTWG